METCERRRGNTWRIQFKSYYVVWKLAPAIAPTTAGFCLNRTMQYGNEEFKKINDKISLGLNRTMQYGNRPGLETFLPPLYV